MKVKELIDSVNEYKKQWTSLEMLWNCIAGNLSPEMEVVAKHINPYKINYGTAIMATDVYKCEDCFVGVTASFHVCGDYADMEIPVIVSEFEESQTISYRPKH